MARWLGRPLAVAAAACLQACRRLRRCRAVDQPPPDHTEIAPPGDSPGFAVTEPAATLLDRCDSMNDDPVPLACRPETLRLERHGDGLSVEEPA